MESREDKTQKKTSSAKVEIIDIPYIDARIPPSAMRFDADGKVWLDAGVEHKFSQDNKALKIDNINVLGEGSFGKVCLAQDSNEGSWYAVKIPVGNISNQAFDKEIQELTEQKIFAFADRKNKYIVMKLLPGVQLWEFLYGSGGGGKSYEELSLLQRLVIAKDILNKMADIHKDVEWVKNKNLNVKDKNEQSKKVQESTIHCDLKPENIIINTETHMVKICDFGLASKLEQESGLEPSKEKNNSDSYDLLSQGETQGKVLSQKIFGTQYFLAPELAGKLMHEYNEKTEVYALGVTFAQVFDLVVGYDDTYTTSIFKRFKFQFHDVDAPSDVINFVKLMMHNNPKERPTVITAAQKFNDLVREYSGKKDYAVTIVVLSIDDFLNMSGSDRNSLIKALKMTANIVVLQGSKKVSNEDYYRVRYALLNHPNYPISVVAGQLYKGEINDVCCAAKEKHDLQFNSLDTKVLKFNKKEWQIEQVIVAQQVSANTIQKDPVYAFRDAFSQWTMTEGFPALAKKHKEIIEPLGRAFLEFKANPMRGFDSFILALEKAYFQILNTHKGLLAGPPDIKEINKNTDKYHACRMLGVMLNAAYTIRDAMPQLDVFNKRHQEVQGLWVPTNNVTEQTNKIIENLKSTAHLSAK
jgi:serine/threonine protein kinase